MQLDELEFDSKSIGKGSYGSVQLALHKPTGIRVAVKKIDRNTLASSKMQATLTREIEI